MSANVGKLVPPSTKGAALINPELSGVVVGVPVSPGADMVLPGEC